MIGVQQQRAVMETKVRSQRLTPEEQQRAADNMAVVYWTLGRYFPRRCRRLRDDYEAVAVDGLLKAARYWRPERGCKFAPYAVLVIRRAVYQWSQRQSQRQRLRERTAGSDQPAGDGDWFAAVAVDRQPEPLEVLAAADDRERTATALRQALVALREYRADYADAVEWRAAGGTDRDAAAQLGKSAETHRDRVRRGYQHLARLLTEGGQYRRGG